MFKFRYVCLSYILASNISLAASLAATFTATIASAPTIAQVTPMNFGVITGNSHATNSVTYTLDTANTVTTSGGGVGSFIGNSATSGAFNVSASAGQALTIYVTGYTNGTAPGGSTVTVGSATCKYGSGTQAPCDSSANALAVSAGSVVATSTLKIGLSISVPAQTTTAGSITGLGYTVNVLYT